MILGDRSSGFWFLLNAEGSRLSCTFIFTCYGVPERKERLYYTQTHVLMRTTHHSIPSLRKFLIITYCT